MPKRPSAPRPAAPLFETAAPAARPSGPRAVPPNLRPSAPRPAVPAPAARPAAPAQAAPRRKRRQSAWPFYVAMGLILLALPAGYVAFIQDGVATSSPELLVPGKPVELKVTQVDGTVEIRRAGGEWVKAQAGDSLQPSDSVRTRQGGKAILSGGDQYEVRLEEQTEVAVDELNDSISRVMLGGGMATAKVQGGGKHTFEVHARNSDAVARTRQGQFAISNNGAGTVAVGTSEGEVEFAGQGKTVIVRAGQQSVVLPGQAPSDPTIIPNSLLLKVDWPAGKTLKKPEVVISGTSEPGAVVMIQGEPAVVDSSGRFSARRGLRQGTNALKVEAQFPGGPRQRAEQVVQVDSRAPKLELPPPDWGK